jgi:NAD-dependent DNA ligase
MAIYNLDNIIDTIVEASSPAAPAGLQMLEAFKKFKHKAQKQKLAKFIEQLDSLSSFLKTRAKEGMNQFFAKFTEYRGRAPAEIYTTPGLVQVAISFLYDKDGM